MADILGSKTHSRSFCRARAPEPFLLPPHGAATSVPLHLQASSGGDLDTGAGVAAVMLLTVSIPKQAIVLLNGISHHQ